jgi:hypothetical protein
MIIVHDVNPVDALRELNQSLVILDRTQTVSMPGYAETLAHEQARQEVLGSIAGLARMLRSVQLEDQPKGGA